MNDNISNEEFRARYQKSETANKLGVMFLPVTVARGRKFRGNGYVFACYDKGNGGYAGSGVRPLLYTTVFQVITPDGKRDEFNSRASEYGRWTLSNVDGVEPWNVSAEQQEKDFLAHVKTVIECCIKRCGSDMKWRANYLCKVLGITRDKLSIINDIAVANGLA